MLDNSNNKEVQTKDFMGTYNNTGTKLVNTW